MPSILSIRGLTKTYASGLEALKGIDLDIEQGEIFALLGPNGAGKTTLINIICGIVTPTQGTVVAGGYDVQREYRGARALIGLVPQELNVFAFEAVEATVRFSRGLYGCPPDARFVEKVLRDLSLWDRRKAKIMALSGGMKRRLMIAKALAHEPRILFLDEPTAGVDVELRHDMWELVRGLRDSGVTVILTTHYIEEAEEMADRVGVINKGELMLVEDKRALMKKLGRKHLALQLFEPLARIPPGLESWSLALRDEGRTLEYRYDGAAVGAGVAGLLQRLAELGVSYHDLHTEESSLEDIFVGLVSERGGQRA